MSIFFGILILLCQILNASEQSLFFPVDRNNVRALPLRFEYQLMDENNFQIGDVLMDFREVRFDILASENQKNMNLRFHWPSGLVQAGEVVIKDSTGKAIWIQKFETGQMKVITRKAEGDEDLRAHLGEMTYSVVRKELIPKLEFLPFFKFCVNYEAPNTKIYICSKDLYLKRNAKSFQILYRESSRKESFVEINGKAANPQGVIILNDLSENLSMRAILQSGANLEIDTHIKDVEFNDVFMTDDEKSLVIRAKGAEPVSSENLRRKSSEEWETTLPIERPYLYIKGEGNIPLRQEFIRRGKVRKENVRVQIDGRSTNKTYGSSLKLGLLRPAELNLSNGDKQSLLTDNQATRATWQLNELEINKKNRRFLKVTTDNMDYFAAYDVVRGASWDFQINLEVPARVDTYIEKWLAESWALSLRAAQQMTVAAAEPDVKSTEFAVLYRLNRGLHAQDPGYGVSLFTRNQTIGSQETNVSFSVLGFGLWGERKLTRRFWGIGDWVLWDFHYGLSGGTADLKLKTNYDFSIKLRRFIASAFYSDLGIRAAQFQYQTPTQTLNSTKGFLHAGIGWIF